MVSFSDTYSKGIAFAKTLGLSIAKELKPSACFKNVCLFIFQVDFEVNEKNKKNKIFMQNQKQYTIFVQKKTEIINNTIRKQDD